MHNAWGSTLYALAADTVNVRAGLVSMKVTGTTSVGDASRTFAGPIDLTGCTATVRAAINRGRVGQALGLELTDTAGKKWFNFFPCYMQTWTNGGVGDYGFLPRTSMSLSVGQYGGPAQGFGGASIDSGFDISKVITIKIYLQASGTFNVTLDSIVISKNFSQPYIGLRVDGQQDTGTLDSVCMFLDWISTFYPNYKVSLVSRGLFTATTTALATNASGVFRTAGLTTYGSIPALYARSAATFGHHIEPFNPLLGVFGRYVDFPLSDHSVMGAALKIKYWIEGIGASPQTARIYPADQSQDLAAQAPLGQNFTASLKGGTALYGYGSLGCDAMDGMLYCIDPDICNPSAGFTIAGIRNSFRDACQTNSTAIGYCGIYDSGASTGWGAGAGHDATSNVLGFGAGWDFDTATRPDLLAAMSFFRDYMLPALAGSLVAGQVPAKWILPSQFIAGGVGGAGGSGGGNCLSLGL